MGWSSVFGWGRLSRTIQNINNSTDSLVRVSEKADKTLTYITNTTLRILRFEPIERMNQLLLI